MNNIGFRNRPPWHVNLAHVLLAGTLAILGTGCGDDPVSYSSPVGIELKAEDGKVVAGVVSDEKGITTESGNPYGAFVSEAKDVLGKDPARVEVTSVTLLVGATSTGVSMLNEVFDGQVEVLFVMNDTDDTFVVARTTVDANTSGGGPLDMEVVFDSLDVAGDNLAKLIGGSFKVVYRGPVAAGFDGSGAKADLQVTFMFEAFEE